jgi:hypothetical protein
VPCKPWVGIMARGLTRIGHVPHTVNDPDHVNRFTTRMTVIYHDGLRLHLVHVLWHQWLRALGFGR